MSRVNRGDYEFFIWTSILGGHVIRAGCRTFTLDEYRKHIAEEYPGTPKAEKTLRILAFLEAELNAWREAN